MLARIMQSKIRNLYSAMKFPKVCKIFNFSRPEFHVYESSRNKDNEKSMKANLTLNVSSCQYLLVQKIMLYSLPNVWTLNRILLYHGHTHLFE